MLRRPLRLALVIVLLAALALPVLARGGGGGGSRSSSGGSRGSSSYSSSRSYGGSGGGAADGGVVVAVVAMLVLAGIVVFAITSLKKSMRRLGGGVDDLVSRLPAVMQGSRSAGAEEALRSIQASDDAFSEARVVQSARAAFERLQSAWASGSMRGCEGLMTPELQAEWERKLDDLKAKGRRNCMEGLEVTAAGVVDAEVAAGTESVTVRFAASAVDYVTDSSGRVVDGSRASRAFVELWRFTRRDPTLCAGCAQPVAAGDPCAGCGTLTGLDGRGWRFEKITASLG